MRESQLQQISPARGNHQSTQRGAAAFLLMALLGLAMGLLVIGHVRNVQGDSTADGRSVLALAKAREALLGYAATYRDTHPTAMFWYLPCPDMGGATHIEGEAQTGCGVTDVTVIGRLPWKTLDLPPLRDASGECLWYAVSGSYKNNPKTADMVNRDTNGLIEVMAADGTSFVAGASARQRAIAVIFSPGAILPGQNRTLEATNPPTICGGNYDPVNYLDTDLLEPVVANRINNAAASTTANDLSSFIAADHADRTPATNDAFNDRLMPILPDEIFTRYVDQRADLEDALTDPLTGVLRLATDCLLTYGRNNPDNDPVSSSSHKYLPFAANLDVTTFGVSANYDDVKPVISGRLPLNVTTSATTNPHKNDNYDSVPLLSQAACPGWDDVDEFWDNWKDHFFYAVAHPHQHKDHGAHDDNPCTGDECIDVENPAPDGITTDMAAVVIFAGAAQAGQTRSTSTDPIFSSADKADPANYLEGNNLTSILINPTDNGFPNRLFSKIDGNDRIMCLSTDLDEGPPTGFKIDPTCGMTARCTSDGALLAAKRAGATNTCRVGPSGIDPDCQTYADRIRMNNCPGAGPLHPDDGNLYSCKRAARDFLSFDCLQGFASTRCVFAHSTLNTCS